LYLRSQDSSEAFSSFECLGITVLLSRIPYLQFFSPELRKELGLPHTLCSESDEEKAHWKYFNEAADQKVVSSSPQLAETCHIGPLSPV
jgi:hypothetical protein